MRVGESMLHYVISVHIVNVTHGISGLYSRINSILQSSNSSRINSILQSSKPMCAIGFAHSPVWGVHLFAVITGKEPRARFV